MAQASRAAKALIYKKKGTHPMIARMHKGKQRKEMEKKHKKM